jgi:hypothetical protein
MSSDDTNKTIIGAMWGTAAFIDFGVAIASVDHGNIDGWLFALPILVALVGTLYIWTMQMRHEERTSQSARSEEQDKSKRQAGDKLSLLMEIMDDDERKEFKERLKQQVLEETAYGSDGELPYGGETLESLMDTDEDKYLRQ